MAPPSPSAASLLLLLIVTSHATHGQVLPLPDVGIPMLNVNLPQTSSLDVSSPMVAAAPTAELSTPKYSVQLDMPSRLQWDEYDGYCGETSVQMSALYYGAWISQYAARNAGGGPQDGGQLLLPADPNDPDVGDAGKNILFALKALKLGYTRFSSQANSQASAMLLWTRSKIYTLKQPVIFVAFVADCDDICDDSYDHIMPATGYSSATSTAVYKSADVLTYSNLYAKTANKRTFGSLPGGSLSPKNKRSCKYDLLSGGCVPTGMNYAVAITGILDAQRTSRPVRLAVDRRDEPNIPLGEAAAMLRGTVTVSALTIGLKYQLLRFDNAASLPTTGNASAFLAAAASGRTDFIATATTWVYTDPTPIISSGTTYYRCVQVV